ncbi:MAG TPA: hypothetical protein VGH86_04875 [Phenylobacterium sp.]|jgi:hypothetical protein
MSYRIFILNEHDEGPMEVHEQFNSDAAAVDHARALLARARAAEVWHGSRLVARLGSDFDLDSRGAKLR